MLASPRKPLLPLTRKTIAGVRAIVHERSEYKLQQLAQLIPMIKAGIRSLKNTRKAMLRAAASKGM